MGRLVLRTSVSAAGPQTGLTFLANGTANSDIRIVWSGANLLSRTLHTFLWKSLYLADTGYRATTWSSHNDGSFHTDTYEYGCHPFPCDGTFDGNGQALGGTGSAGTEHYHEIAGLGAQDRISSPGGANGGSKILVLNTWRWYARQAFVSGPDLVHRHYRNLENDLTDFIEQRILLADLAAAGASPAFYFGCSDWTSGAVGAGTNVENPYGHHRGFAGFNAALTASECQTELASDSNSAQTAAGAAAVWYINKNPTPSDVSDKSGAGHSPSWANANRPTLWTP